MPTRPPEKRRRRKKTDPFDSLQVAVAQRIRQLRRTQDLTQEEVSGRVGMDYRYWQKCESGQLNPSLRTLLRLAHGLEVEITDLFSPPEAPWTKQTGKA